jgi:hypothetical protein
MGAEPYFYFVEYQEDLDQALQGLRRREFLAGRYSPAMEVLRFPVDPKAPSPGAQHDSIEEAFEDADADGTRSILDLDRISEEPDFGAVTPLSDEVLREIYGTDRPTRKMIEKNMGFFDELDRGHGTAIVVWRDDQPDEIFFAGYSYD